MSRGGGMSPYIICWGVGGAHSLASPSRGLAEFGRWGPAPLLRGSSGSE